MDDRLIKHETYLLQGLRTAETLASEHCDLNWKDGRAMGGGKMVVWFGGPEGEEIGMKGTGAR